LRGQLRRDSRAGHLEADPEEPRQQTRTPVVVGQDVAAQRRDVALLGPPVVDGDHFLILVIAVRRF